MGIFSLAGMSAYVPGSAAYIEEVCRRVLTNSDEGHIVINKSIDANDNADDVAKRGVSCAGKVANVASPTRKTSKSCPKFL